MSPKQESPPPLARREAIKAPPAIEYTAKRGIEQPLPAARLQKLLNPQAKEGARYADF